MKRLWTELSLSPQPFAALILGLVAGLWINPVVLYSTGASGYLAARLLEVVAYVIGAMLGVQLLTPELRGRTAEMIGARSPGLAGVLFVRMQLALAAWLVVSSWVASLLLWSDPGRSMGLLTLSFAVSGFVGLALATAALTHTGSQTAAMAASSFVFGAFLVLKASGWALGAVELFPLYSFYTDTELFRAKLFWLLVAVAFVGYALYRAHRPVALLREAAPD